MLKKLFKNKVFIFSICILIPMFIIAIIGPLLALYDPLKQDASNTLQSSSLSHLFGTDEYGRDIFRRLLFGLRRRIIIAYVSPPISMVIEVNLGILVGYREGTI